MLDAEFEIEIAKANKSIERRLARFVGETGAEDVWQNTCLKAWLAKDKFRGDCTFFTWLNTIAFNEARMYVRQHQYIQISDIEQKLYITPKFDEALIYGEQSSQLKKMIPQLSTKFKVAILDYLNERPFHRVTKCRALKLLIEAHRVNQVQ